MPINKKYFVSSVALSLALCMAQIRGSRMLILLCLGAYMVMLAWGSVRNHTLPLLLYFMPWSSLMRLGPDSFSFFTFGLVMVCAIGVMKKKLSLKVYALLAGFLLASMTLLAKLLERYPLTFGYVAFLMMIVLIPVVKEEYKFEKYDFYHATVFLSAGVVVAALCAMRYASLPNISRYIRVDNYNTIIRRCGFYGDPNFYTAQITAAMSGCLVLLLREKKKKRTVWLMALLAVLVYCGFLSGSKSFVLVSLLMLCLWLLRLVQVRNRWGLKLLLLLSMILLGIYIANSELFRNLLQVIETRFSDSANLNRLTTGRAAIWKRYAAAWVGDAKTFFLGKGIADVILGRKSMHNSILQALFQLGLLGTPVLCFWIWNFLRDGLRGRVRNIRLEQQLQILLIGVFLPWMAIDILLFDDFFLLQWYVFVAYRVGVTKSE